MSHELEPLREGEAPARSGAPLTVSFFDRLKQLRFKPYLDVHIVDHCNLRCAGCVHFAPLAEPRFLDPDAFERDLALLGAVPGIGAYFETLSLMGGEPTLHPQLPEILRLSRRYLPDMPITLDTNGLLLKRMDDAFWSALAETGIGLAISPYPIKVDYPALVALAEAHGVTACFAGDVTRSDSGKEVFYRLAVDSSGSRDPVYEFNRCPFGGGYLQLHDGVLWPCQVAAHHGALNAAFGCGLQSEEADRLPLLSLRSTEQIDELRRRAHPMCRYCDNDALVLAPWGHSKRERSEWLVR